MEQNLRELATTPHQIVHRIATEDSELREVLHDHLSPGELEIFVQDLSEAGKKAQLFRPTVHVREKGI